MSQISASSPETIKPREFLVKRLWRGQDPFADFPYSPDNVDVQGWGGSRHPWFEDTIARLKPSVIVEIGVWKGASALHMAGIAKRLGLGTLVIAVDTWLGSSEHWLNNDWFKGLVIKNGRPTMQNTFMSNVISQELQHHVLPLPLDSGNAAEVLKSLGVEADLIHIDAGHDHQSVTTDLNTWWPRLRKGGVLIGDDYHHDGQAWPGVKSAFDKFVTAHQLAFDYSRPKIRLTKP